MRENLNDLQSFIIVAREQSFTRAAAQIGVSQSALSHAMRGLEERLGLRLLTRTTRSVSPTDAGERLLKSIVPHFEGIERGLTELTELRDKPSGSVRINSGATAVNTILWPKLRPLLADYPDIRIEIIVDNGLIDIVAGRYDAGVRLGEHLAKDMIAVPISGPLTMAAIASPHYFARHPVPRVPQDLMEHACINLRLPTHGGLYGWEFEKDGQELKVRVDGQITFNSPEQIVQACLDGVGIAMLVGDSVDDLIAKGRLVRVLADWCPPFSGYHLYYPSRRQMSPALALVVNALRWRG